MRILGDEEEHLRGKLGIAGLIVGLACEETGSRWEASLATMNKLEEYDEGHSGILA